MGGGLAVSSGPATILNFTFAGNYANFTAADLQGRQEVSMGNSLFVDNWLNRDGGLRLNSNTNDKVATDLGGNRQFLDADISSTPKSN